MAKYIKYFNDHDAYTSFTQTEEFITPNVSYCELQDEVHYNPISKEQTPMTIDCEDGYVGENSSINVTVPADATGTVTLTITLNEQTIDVLTESISDGRADFDFIPQQAGTYVVYATYGGDNIYESAFTNESFDVTNR